MPNLDHRQNSVKASLRRVRLIASQTLAEALRLRLTGLLGLTAGLLVLMALWLRALNFGAAELKFISDFGLGAIGMLGTLLAALATAHLCFSDFAGGVIGCVLTRPVRRWEYMAGKLSGVMALLGLFIAALALELAVIIAARESQLGTAGFAQSLFLQACALIWFKVTLVAAMTLLVCSYAGTTLFASCAGLLLGVVAQLRPFTDPTGWLALLRLGPNLSLFDVEPIMNGGGMAAGEVMALTGYWAVYLLLLVGLASYVFKHREF